jgi:hypothetical protein
MTQAGLLGTGKGDYVRGELSRIFLGVLFKPARVALGRTSDGLTVYHEFDAVSEDRTVVAIIDNAPWLYGEGERDAARVSMLYHELYLLSLTTAISKLLVLTDRSTYLGFGQESDGLISKDIKLVHIALPDEDETPSPSRSGLN